MVIIMATSIINLVSSIIDGIRDTSLISSISNVGNIYTINTPDTKRLVIGDFISISGNNYKILTLTINTKFTVSSTIPIIGSTWTALAPYFFYGTPIMISNSIDHIKDYQEKYPIIVLFETMPAVVNDDETKNLERTVSLEMYFCNEANFKDWDSSEYYSNVIDKMQVYIDDFIKQCENTANIGLLSSHSETSFSKWNLKRLDTGTNVFNAELSAIKLEIDLPILKTLECESD